jgi:hypothetical protein
VTLPAATAEPAERPRELPQAPNLFAVSKRIRVDKSNVLGIQLKEMVPCNNGRPECKEMTFPGYVASTDLPPCYVEPGPPGSLIVGAATDQSGQYFVAETSSGKMLTDHRSYDADGPCPSGITFIIEASRFAAGEGEAPPDHVRLAALHAARKRINGE